MALHVRLAVVRQVHVDAVDGDRHCAKQRVLGQRDRHNAQLAPCAALRRAWHAPRRAAATRACGGAARGPRGARGCRRGRRAPTRETREDCTYDERRLLRLGAEAHAALRAQHDEHCARAVRASVSAGGVTRRSAQTLRTWSAPKRAISRACCAQPAPLGGAVRERHACARSQRCAATRQRSRAAARLALRTRNARERRAHP